MRCSSSGVNGNVLWANITKEEYLAGIGNAFAVFYTGPTPIPVPEAPLIPVVVALTLITYIVSAFRKKRNRKAILQ